MAEAESAGYGEFAVEGPLREHLVCLWSSTVAPPPAPHPILPDACVDIVFIADRPPIVAGPATLPVFAALPAGAALTGARFRPGAAAEWFRTAAHEMQNLDVPLRDLWGPATDRLREEVFRTASPAARRAIVRDALTARLPDVPEADPLVDEAISRLARDLSLHVGDLSRQLYLSERQFLRRFRERVGYGPKTLQRILRLQRLLLLAARPGERARGLGTIAADAGYADQAHMGREVRELAGETPQDLLHRQAGTLGLSDLFKPEGVGGR